MPKLIDIITASIKTPRTSKSRTILPNRYEFPKPEKKITPYSTNTIERAISGYLKTFNDAFSKASEKYHVPNQPRILKGFYKSVAEDFFSDTKENYKIKERAKKVYNLVANSRYNVSIENAVEEIYAEIKSEIESQLNQEKIEKELFSFKEMVKRLGKDKVGEIYDDIMKMEAKDLVDGMINHILDKILLEELMDEIKKNVFDETNEQGYSLLHIFCEQEDEKLVKQLIERGWDIKKVSSVSGETPLDIANKKKNKNIAKLLKATEEPQIKTKGLNSIQKNDSSYEKPSISNQKSSY